RCLPVAKQANESLNTGDLVEGERLVVLLEKYSNIGPTGGTTTSGPQLQPSDRSKANELHHRLGVVLEWLKTAKTKEEMASTVERCVPVARDANEAYKQGNLVEAERLIVLLEKYTNIGGTSTETPKTETTGPTIGQRPPRPTSPPPQRPSKRNFDQAKLGVDN